VTEPPLASCRLYAILARDGRSAVVFRRGPSRQVLVLRWRLKDDAIEPGQWLKGRIYERRCDLSPDGDLLIYFAAKWETTMSTWTAVSRTPYLTALALWAKGDAWGGGGVFKSAHVIGLNHRTIGGAQAGAGVAKPRSWHPLDAQQRLDSVIPKRFTVEHWSEHAGYGEDNPLHDHRLTRDGWTCVSGGQAGRHGETKGYAWVLSTPEIYERPQPSGAKHSGRIVLRRILNAIGQRDGPWYVEDHEVLSPDGDRLRLLKECSWADWQTTGDLLFAIGGRLYRLPQQRAGEKSDDPLANAELVADLGPLTFTPAASPVWAREWP
jgi:hypothetical protein